MRRRRRVRTAGVPLLVAAALLAACAARRAPLPHETPVAAGPLLWRVEHRGEVSHLFGTIHLGRELENALGAAGVAALAEARTVFVEMDLSDRARARALAAEAARAGRLPPGQSLRAMLEPDVWTRLRRLLPDVPPASLDRTEPWLAALSTIQAIAARSAATPATAGTPGGVRRVPMDVVVVERARRAGARVVELDSMAQQLAVFQRLPREEAIAMLAELLRDPERAGGQLRAIVDAYGAGDAERRMASLVADMARRTPTFAEHLLFQRNQRWVDQLDASLRAGGAFVAVGAGHLVGPRGVPALLAARGFRVARVTSGPPRISLAPDRAAR